MDLFGFARGSLDFGLAGGGLELEQRIGARGALFTRGWIGGAWNDGRSQLAGEISAGARFRW